MSIFQHLRNVSAPESSDTISLYELLGLIQHNPNKDKIEPLYSLEKGNDDYDAIKEELPCIKPHGTFDGYCDSEHLRQFSGYIYFDVDDLTITQEEMVNRYGHLMSLCGRSVGGRCHFFMVKVNHPEVITPDNFLSIQNYVQVKYFSELPIDENGKGLIRNFIIPFDKDVYFNHEANVDISSFNVNPKKEKSITSTIKGGEGVNATCDTFLDISEVLSQIKWKTEIPVEVWNSDYILHEHGFFRLFIPQVIEDGKKHKVFSLMVNAIVYNNPSISYECTVSFINYVNQKHTGDKPMKRKEMEYVVRREYDRITATGEASGMKRKHVLVNPALTGEERQRAGAKGWGEYRKNRSLQLMRETLEQFRMEGVKPKQKDVAERLTGKLSIATIKRLWPLLVERKQPENKDEEIERYLKQSSKLWKPKTPEMYLKGFVLPDTALLLRTEVNRFEKLLDWVNSRLQVLQQSEVRKMVGLLKEGEYDDFMEYVESMASKRKVICNQRF